MGVPATEVEALGRALASEASSHSDEERRAIGWAIRNMSAKRRKSIYQLGGGGSWGAQGEAGRPFSTARPARDQDMGLAAQVLFEASDRDPTYGGTAFFEPAAQDQYARYGALYRASPSQYPQYERFKLYKSDATDLRRRWLDGHMSPTATVGRWEFWRDGKAARPVADARQEGGGGVGAGLASLLLWAVLS